MNIFKKTNIKRIKNIKHIQHTKSTLSIASVLTPLWLWLPTTIVHPGFLSLLLPLLLGMSIGGIGTGLGTCARIGIISRIDAAA